MLKKNIRGVGSIIFFLFLVFLISVPGICGATADTLAVKAYGSAVKDGNASDARDSAMSEAIRDALSGAVNEYLRLHAIEADEPALTTAIYSRADSFVLNYKILSERWISDIVDVPVDESGETQPGGLAPTVPLAEGPPTYHVLINVTLDMGAVKRAILGVMGAEKSLDFKLVLLDISDYETFTSILTALKGVPVIEDLSYKSFSRDRFVLGARSLMDPLSLAAEVAREAGRDFVVTAYGMDTIIIKAFPVASTP